MWERPKVRLLDSYLLYIEVNLVGVNFETIAFLILKYNHCFINSVLTPYKLDRIVV